jgi:hypothetical protein
VSGRVQDSVVLRSSRLRGHRIGSNPCWLVERARELRTTQAVDCLVSRLSLHLLSLSLSLSLSLAVSLATMDHSPQSTAPNCTQLHLLPSNYPPPPPHLDTSTLELDFLRQGTNEGEGVKDWSNAPLLTRAAFLASSQRVFPYKTLMGSVLEQRVGRGEVPLLPRES